MFPRPTSYLLISFRFLHEIEEHIVNSSKRSVIFLRSWIWSGYFSNSIGLNVQDPRTCRDLFPLSLSLRFLGPPSMPSSNVHTQSFQQGFIRCRRAEHITISKKQKDEKSMIPMLMYDIIFLNSSLLMFSTLLRCSLYFLSWPFGSTSSTFLEISAVMVANLHRDS